MDLPVLEAETTTPIFDIFRDVHRTFGLGYREHIYRLAVERDLRRLGHLVEREVGVIVYYRREPLARQRLDMVVNSRVVVEIKATEQLHPSRYSPGRHRREGWKETKNNTDQAKRARIEPHRRGSSHRDRELVK
jgi:GxxExxY protein